MPEETKLGTVTYKVTGNIDSNSSDVMKVFNATKTCQKLDEIVSETKLPQDQVLGILKTLMDMKVVAQSGDVYCNYEGVCNMREQFRQLRGWYQ